MTASYLEDNHQGWYFWNRKKLSLCKALEWGGEEVIKRYSEKEKKVLSDFTVIHSRKKAATIVPNSKLWKTQCLICNMPKLPYCIYSSESTLTSLSSPFILLHDQTSLSLTSQELASGKGVEKDHVQPHKNSSFLNCCQTYMFYE